MLMTQSSYTPGNDALLPNDPEAFERERERMHRQMLSSVSHDLKTPLASMIGSLEVYDRMKDRLNEDKKLELVAVALQEAYRLDNFITNILDMGKLDNGMVKPKHEQAELGIVIRDCLMRMSNRLKNVKINVTSSAPIPIVTDPVLLSRAVSLALDNAVKYGGVPPVIDIETNLADDNWATIHIHDNGPGVPPSQMEAVFSKYTRFAKGDQQNAGTGLGLAIGRAIMELLGGTMTAGNHSRGGGYFTLRFPTK
jgi:K+-sensing histidine kinase KdpD